jgi:MFS-type transporter involved in bile tolerance (Atg22 family)
MYVCVCGGTIHAPDLFLSAHTQMQVVIGAYLPLLMQQVALERAGFPDDCPNFAAVRGNTTLSTLVFGTPMDDFFLDNAQFGKSACTSACSPFEGNTYCEGKPKVPLECLTADGDSRHRLTVSMGTWRIDPTEYALVFIGISVITQFVAFLLCGSLGDYGGLRKQVYAVSTWIGCAACVCCFAVTTELWYLGGVFLVIGNLAFGISVLM